MKFQKVSTNFNPILSLMGEVLVKAREKNTLKSYFGYFEKWELWCAQFPEVSVIPTKEIHIILYLLTLLQVGKKFPVIKTSLYAIKYFHKIVGYQDPCNSELANYVLEGIKRICCHISNKKSPIRSQQLHDLYKLYGGNKMNLLNLRTFLISVLSFMGFLRFSEAVNLRHSDIIFHGTHISIFIEKSKTDVYRQGHWLHLAKLKSQICPIKLLKRYYSMAQITKSSDKYLFRQLIHTRKGYKLKDLDKPISYTSIRESVLSGLERIGLNKKDFGLHSLRSGGATAAANLGVNDRLFQKHGRWKSANIKDGYVHENTDALLTVSKNLGL